MNKLITIAFLLFAASAFGHSRTLECEGVRTPEEIRSVSRNRGLVLFDGQPRYGIFTFGPGSHYGYNCQGNSRITLMYRYYPERNRVIFFECRNGWVFFNLDDRGGSVCN